MPQIQDFLPHCIPRVLKLSRHKFACYVECYSGQLPMLTLAGTSVKIVSRRKRARRVALNMARRIGKSLQQQSARERHDASHKSPRQDPRP